MSYIYEVFEHLKQLWMGISLGEFAEIIDDVSAEMIPVEPFKLHPTSMSYIYMVFEPLK
jgi:hypothetical protein